MLNYRRAFTGFGCSVSAELPNTVFVLLDLVLRMFYTMFATHDIVVQKWRSHTMSSQERASIVAIITSLLLNAYVIVTLVRLFGAGALSGEHAPMVWAQAIVWVIPAAIGLTIVLNWLLAMASKDRNQRNVVDERDRQFQLRGLYITLISIGIGYMTMIVVLATGWSAVAGLTLLYAFCAVGDLLGNVVRLGSYRIGA